MQANIESTVISEASRQIPAVDKPNFIVLSHQRSGTHFLQASLASHPEVHARDECFMHFRRGDRGESDARLLQYDLRNRPGACNLAIVMYSQVALYEHFCGSLREVGIIHLLRNPRAVALSVARMKVEKAAAGEAYRSHYFVGEVPPLHATVSDATVDWWEASVKKEQNGYLQILQGHPRLLTLSYEELTNGRQTNLIEPALSERILSFLGVSVCALTNSLQKTG